MVGVTSSNLVSSIMQRSGARPGLAELNPEESEIVCIEHGILRVIRDLSLVLSSQNISHTVLQSELGPWEIYVKENEVYVAQSQIALYKQENPNWERDMATLPMLKPSVQPLWFLLIPAVCTFIQFKNPHITAFGVSDAAKILKGEWWRLFTAQTIHNSSYHLASNLIFGFFVFSLISIKMPLSRIAPFIILAAAFANLETALIMKNYSSLGFSTTVFAGLGALATLEVRVLKRTENFGRLCVPWIAAFLLHVFLGLGDEKYNVDILGHFFGLLMGAIAGFIPPKKWLHWGEPIGIEDDIIVLGIYVFFAFIWLKSGIPIPHTLNPEFN